MRFRKRGAFSLGRGVMGRVHAGAGSGYSGGRGGVAGPRGEIRIGVGIRGLDASAPVRIRGAAAGRNRREGAFPLNCQRRREYVLESPG
jgi:hypothetical protein